MAEKPVFERDLLLASCSRREVQPALALIKPLALVVDGLCQRRIQFFDSKALEDRGHVPESSGLFLDQLL